METGGLNLNSSSGSAPGSGLRPGGILHATVSSDLGQNRYLLQSGGRKLLVESPAPLLPGQRLDLQVVRQNSGQLALQLLPDASAAATPAQAPANGTASDSSMQKSGAAARSPASSAGQSSALTGDTASTAKLQELTIAADAVRVLLPARGDPAGSSGKASSSANNGNNATPSASAAGEPAAAQAATATSGDAASEVSSAAAQDATEEASTQARTSAAPSARSFPPVLLTLLIDQKGFVSLQSAAGETLPPDGTLPAGMQTVEVATEARAGFAAATGDVPASGLSGATFQLQHVSLLLDILPPESGTSAMALTAPSAEENPDKVIFAQKFAGTIRFPLTPELLNSLPDSLSGTKLTLIVQAAAQDKTSQPSQNQSLTVTAQTENRTIAAGLTLPAAAFSPEVRSFVRESVTTSNPVMISTIISDEAILTGMLRSERAAPEIQIPAAENPLATAVHSAGLTPGRATLQAAQALQDQAVPISRGNLQTLLALTVGRIGEERMQFLQAGAKLLALDAPVSAPLAAGLVSLAAPDALVSMSGKIAQTIQCAGDALPDHPALAQAARQMSALSVLVGEADTPQALSGFVSTLGREVLSSARQSIDNAAAALVATSPALANLDAALEVTLAGDAGNPQGLPSDGGLDASPRAGEKRLSGLALFATGLPNTQAPGVPESPITGTMPDTTPAESTTLPSGKASPLPASVALPDSQPLPLPMAPAPTLLSPLPAAGTPTGQPGLPIAPELTAGQPTTTPEAGQRNALPADAVLRPQPLTMQLQAGIGDNALFPPGDAHPGVHDFPLDARPVESSTGQDAAPHTEQIQQVVREILRADTPERAAHAARDAMRNLDASSLRELNAALQQAEREELTCLPGMSHLREASEGLRDLGRAFVAQKAESLAGPDPAVWAGSVPLKFGNEAKDGHLQMFYRKGKEGKDWTQRVMLDLDMSGIGEVIGDLKFFQGQLTVSLLSHEARTIDWLAEGADELAAGLEAAGYPCAPAFRLLKQEETPLPAAEPSRATPGRLDVRA